jgi:hypothetical protein
MIFLILEVIMIDFNVNKSNINQVKTLNKDDFHSNLKFLNPIKTDFSVVGLFEE